MHLFANHSAILEWRIWTYYGQKMLRRTCTSWSTIAASIYHNVLSKSDKRRRHRDCQCAYYQLAIRSSNSFRQGIHNQWSANHCQMHVEQGIASNTVDHQITWPYHKFYSSYPFPCLYLRSVMDSAEVTMMPRIAWPTYIQQSCIYITRNYQLAIHHCKRVMGTHENTHVVDGLSLPKINDDINSVLSIVALYQYLRKKTACDTRLQSADPHRFPISVPLNLLSISYSSRVTPFNK
jgi:hypothetical protein